ncbi:MAG: polymerase sigma-70 factor [Pedobacter sp.]|jgi:RNA polymerase sigma-70 factor (family 1)|nr:polymerase sigma-70 factor [Pedobacter sp.]
MLLTKCTDSELWDSIASDNSKAFDVLFERYWTVVYGTAFSYLKDTDASTQIVHDIFLAIWEKRKVYKINCFKQYLCSAARYHVYKQLKVKKSSNLVYVEDYENSSLMDHSRNQGDEKVRYLELERDLHNSLHQLPKRCREIFSLSRTDNLTNEEISQRLGISKRSVENQLTTALQFVRSYLKYTIILLFFLR